MKKTKKWIMFLLMALLLTGIFGANAKAASTTVATIGSKKYSSLESALKNVKNGQVIVLKKSMKYAKSINVERNVKFTLNLNGKTITFIKGTACIRVKKGTLGIKNGKVTNSVKNGCAFKIEKGAKGIWIGGTYTGMIKNLGTVTINSGTFQAKGTYLLYNAGMVKINDGTFNQNIVFNREKESPEWDNGAILYSYANEAKVAVYGGTFKSTTLIFKVARGNVTVKKGTFASTNGGNILVYKAGSKATSKVIVEGGTWSIKEDWGIAYNHDSVLSIRGGTFKSEWSLVETYADNALLNITGGNFTTTTDTVPICICYGGKMNLSGGRFVGRNTWGYWIDPEGNGKVNINGASFIVKQRQKTGNTPD